MLLMTSRVLLSLLSASPSPAPEPLCAGRAPCSVSETLDAGKDAQGQRLQVLGLSLGWFSRDAVEGVGRKFTAAGRKKQGSPDNDQCEAREWWLRRPGAPDQLLLSVCNDGYGASGVGEDDVTVQNNRFTHRQSGGSGQRWSNENTLQLSPLVRVASSALGYFSFDPDKATSQEWETASLQGHVEVPAPECAEGEKSTGERSLPYLPWLQVDPAYLQEGWKQVALGGCALDAGSVLLGAKVAPKNASLKAVLLGRDSLLLEVRDDRWTGPGAKWLADDHVELWLGPDAPALLSGCGKPKGTERPVQWGIRVTDGKVFPAQGSPTQALAVDKVELREADKLVGYRLKVTLPGEFKGVTVVYSDSDTGKKQERLIATSPLVFARPETLNPLREVPPEEATCVVRGTALAVEPTPLKPEGPDVAVLGD